MLDRPRGRTRLAQMREETALYIAGQDRLIALAKAGDADGARACWRASCAPFWCG
ncbi:hypothetical protein GCM10007388_05150 [Pseudoduganella plicata]|uniref:Uncharacterized protein n=1 Tax=Pseudoduganella plicata TaxID=321984 RepID=A0AA88C6K8_9BURK|nr:hypothetical protein GCM10007388_05150 [Pseudoduganella plicata]